jgi:hypothetical protein
MQRRRESRICLAFTCEPNHQWVVPRSGASSISTAVLCAPRRTRAQVETRGRGNDSTDATWESIMDNVLWFSRLTLLGPKPRLWGSSSSLVIVPVPSLCLSNKILLMRSGIFWGRQQTERANCFHGWCCEDQGQHAVQEPGAGSPGRQADMTG